MPIDFSNLDNLVNQQSVATVIEYSPKFFSPILTGNGKKVGLLCEANNPMNPLMMNRPTNANNLHCKKDTTVSGDTKTYFLPLNTIPIHATCNLWDYYLHRTAPDPTLDATMQKIGTIVGKKNNVNADIYISLDIHSIILEETTHKDGTKESKFQPCYQINLFTIADSKNLVCEKGLDFTALDDYSKNRYDVQFSCDPYNTLIQILKNGNPNRATATIDMNAIDDYFSSLSVYGVVAKRATEWNTTISETVEDFIKQLIAQPKTNRRTNRVTGVAPDDETIIIRLVRDLERYQIPLTMSRNIYDILVKYFNTQPDVVSRICKANLNLLLSDTLASLNKNKALLNTLGKPNGAVPLPTMAHSWSKEQQVAISTTEPLVLVQAGAGTGKSTAINGRMLYMINCGVKPEDITVLSFTNAAADHISELNSQVHSMTIAKMIHTIYSENFSIIDPNTGEKKCKHELSSISTVRNCLEIYFQKNPLAERFSELLYDIAYNVRGAWVKLNAFVEENYDKVIDMLDTLGQTTLELEIIICYQKIDSFVEPPEVQSKFLIVDEVQDNSIFEFIYLIKYVDKHKESLFIVGDGSQTLYEFRGSDSKALNALEGSNVFTTYQLQINYRSNQEILDFANSTLADIEANQFAHIQLHANSLAKVTERTFRNKVNLQYQGLSKVGDYLNHIGPDLGGACKPFIDACLARGEQIAIIAYKRREVQKAEDAIKTLYPQATTANIIPERIMDSCVFSTFIKKYWHEIKFVPSQNFLDCVEQAIQNRCSYIMHGDEQKNQVALAKMLYSWKAEYFDTVNGLVAQYQAGIITKDKLLEEVKESLLAYEIESNAIRQSLLSTRNEEKKLEDYSTKNFIFSTIHSVKGLEFDNVIIIHKTDNRVPEDDKRMFYVAFTRAKNSECILSYNTVKTPRIQSDYNLICKALHDKDLEQARKVGKTHMIKQGKMTFEEIDDDFYDADGHYNLGQPTSQPNPNNNPVP